MTLLFAETAAENAMLAAWTAERIPHFAGADFGPCQAGAVLRGGRVVAAVVFHDWQPAYRTLQVSIAADVPGWAQRGVLCGMFHYAFVTAGANKLWAAMRHKAGDVLAFNKRLGFRREGVLRHHFGPGEHAVIASMLRAEWERGPWFRSV